MYKVKYSSPGTFFSEENTHEFRFLDWPQIIKKSFEIVQRHGAKPHSFTIENDPIKRTYWLGGQIKTLAEVEQENDPNNETLIWNMKTNKIDFVITNNNSFKSTWIFEENDILIPYDAKNKSFQVSFETMPKF